MDAKLSKELFKKLFRLAGVGFREYFSCTAADDDLRKCKYRITDLTQYMVDLENSVGIGHRIRSLAYLYFWNFLLLYWDCTCTCTCTPYLSSTTNGAVSEWPN